MFQDGWVIMRLGLQVIKYDIKMLNIKQPIKYKGTLGSHKYKLCTHPNVITNQHDFLSSMKHKKGILKNVLVYTIKVNRVQTNI